MWTLPTASSLAGFSSLAAHTLPSATALPSLLPLRRSRSQPTFPAACHLLKLIKSQNTFTSPTLSFLLMALWPPHPTLTQSLRILDFLNYWYHSVPFLKLNFQLLLVLCASQWPSHCPGFPQSIAPTFGAVGVEQGTHEEPFYRFEDLVKSNTALCEQPSSWFYKAASGRGAFSLMWSLTASAPAQVSVSSTHPSPLPLPSPAMPSGRKDPQER